MCAETPPDRPKGLGDVLRVAAMLSVLYVGRCLFTASMWCMEVTDEWARQN